MMVPHPVKMHMGVNSSKAKKGSSLARYGESVDRSRTYQDTREKIPSLGSLYSRGSWYNPSVVLKKSMLL